MTQISQTFLTHAEVREVLRKFEEQYGFSTQQFLCDPNLKSRMPEDDVFRWGAYADFLRELDQLENELHRGYLSRMVQDACGPNNESIRQRLLDLAA